MSAKTKMSKFHLTILTLTSLMSPLLVSCSATDLPSSEIIQRNNSDDIQLVDPSNPKYNEPEETEHVAYQTEEDKQLDALIRPQIDSFPLVSASVIASLTDDKEAIVCRFGKDAETTQVSPICDDYLEYAYPELFVFDAPLPENCEEHTYNYSVIIKDDQYWRARSYSCGL